METLFGKVWDNSHILTENVLLVIYDIPEYLVGETGYFLVENKGGFRFLQKCLVK